VVLPLREAGLMCAAVRRENFLGRVDHPWATLGCTCMRFLSHVRDAGEAASSPWSCLQTASCGGMTAAWLPLFGSSHMLHTQNCGVPRSNFIVSHAL
jgi:hypothetical protein